VATITQPYSARSLLRKPLTVIAASCSGSCSHLPDTCPRTEAAA
jgi:hypothetical protein